MVKRLFAIWLVTQIALAGYMLYIASRKNLHNMVNDNPHKRNIGMEAY